MHVVHLIGSLERGGAESFLARLVTAVAGREPQWRQSVWTLTAPGPLAGEVRAAGIDVRAFGMTKSPAGLSRLAGMARAVARERPSVIQCWMYHAEAVGTLARVLGAKAPQIWSLRQSRLSGDANPLATRLLMRLCAAASSRVAAAVVANSEAALDAHRAIGYRAPRLPVIRNGVDTRAFAPDADARRRQRQAWGVDGGTILIGYLARVAPVKGHTYLLRAAARLAADETLPPWRLVCVGAGTARDDPSFAALLHDSGIADRCISAGPSSAAAAVLPAFDVAVSSSLGEGFPNAVAEGLACAVPTVATDVGDMRVLLADPSWLVPPGDDAALAAALARMLRLPADVRRALGTAARAHIDAHYRFDDAVDAHIALYRALAAAAGSSGRPV